MTARQVLLVEDDASDEKLTRHALNRSGVDIDVVVARDGAAALDLLARALDSALPAVVLLDLKLPRVDGIDVLRRIRSNPRTRLVPVVVLTSSNEDEDVRQSYAAGANAYVRKSVDFGQFSHAVGLIGAFFAGINELPRAVNG